MISQSNSSKAMLAISVHHRLMVHHGNNFMNQEWKELIIRTSNLEVFTGFLDNSSHVEEPIVDDFMTPYNSNESHSS
jgi:hypothetical protein